MRVKFEGADGIGVSQATAAPTVEVGAFNGGAVDGGELHLEEHIEPVAMEVVHGRRGVHEEVVYGGLHAPRQEGIGSSNRDGVQDVPEGGGIASLRNIVMVRHDEALDFRAFQQPGTYKLTDLPFILGMYLEGQLVERHDERGYWDRERDDKDGEGVCDEKLSLEEVVQLGAGYTVDQVGEDGLLRAGRRAGGLCMSYANMRGPEGFGQSFRYGQNPKVSVLHNLVVGDVGKSLGACDPVPFVSRGTGDVGKDIIDAYAIHRRCLLRGDRERGVGPWEEIGREGIRGRGVLGRGH